MLDLTKPIQTRDGLRVRIICSDRKGLVPIVALVSGNGIHEEIRSYTNDGKWFYVGASTDDELVNVPQRHKHADVIIAWANGAQIQFYSKSIEDWEDISRPLWEINTQYRVKPT